MKKMQKFIVTIVILLALVISISKLRSPREESPLGQSEVAPNPRENPRTDKVAKNKAQIVSEKPKKPEAKGSPVTTSPEVPMEILAFEQHMAEAFSRKDWNSMNSLLDEALEYAKDQSRDYLFRGHFITSAASLLATLRANQELAAETEEQWTAALTEILDDENQHEFLRGRAALTAGHGGLTGMLADIWKVAEATTPNSDGRLETRALVGASHLEDPAEFATRASSVLKNALNNGTDPLSDAAALLIAEAGQPGAIRELLELRRDHRDSRGLRLSLASVNDWQGIADLKDPEQIALIIDNLDAPALNRQTAQLADLFVKNVIASGEWSNEQQKQFQQIRDAAFLMESHDALAVFRVLSKLTTLDQIKIDQKQEITALFNHFNVIAEHE